RFQVGHRFGAQAWKPGNLRDIARDQTGSLSVTVSSARLFPSRRGVMLHHQRNAGELAAIDRDIDRINARMLELQLLKIDDEIARAEMHLTGQNHFQRHWWKIRRNRTAVGVDKIELEVVLA